LGVNHILGSLSFKNVVVFGSIFGQPSSNRIKCYGGLFTALLLVTRFVAARLSTARSIIKTERNVILFAMAQGLTPVVLAFSTLTLGIPESPVIVTLTLSMPTDKQYDAITTRKLTKQRL
jgi:hypothetical protein